MIYKNVLIERNENGMFHAFILGQGSIAADTLKGIKAMIAPLQTFNVELADTFGGESNYSWVKRCTIQARDEAHAIRQAKAWAGLNGIKCRKDIFCDSIALYPCGICWVLFIS